jgi:hypothetical protein
LGVLERCLSHHTLLVVSSDRRVGSCEPITAFASPDRGAVATCRVGIWHASRPPCQEDVTKPNSSIDLWYLACQHFRKSQTTAFG